MLAYDRERDEADHVTPFLAIALAFPGVVYTVLLGVALVYWIFVMVGAAHINLLGDGAADAAADAALDGVAKGVLEGATKGVLEGVAEHLDGAGADGGDLDVGEAGGPTGIIAALKLRSAPATVVLSLLILFSWMFAIGGMQLTRTLALEGAAATAMKLGLFFLAPIFSLLPTSIAVRPLARVFAPPPSVTHAGLVGKMCRIRTGTVTDRFGEALLEDGGAGVVVRVRVESGEKLARGDQAVIVGYDAERQEFTVAPFEIDDRDEDPPALKRRGAR
jgi:hypothetical protein